jgi:hypothetical protein
MWFWWEEWLRWGKVCERDIGLYLWGRDNKEIMFSCDGRKPFVRRMC